LAKLVTLVHFGRIFARSTNMLQMAVIEHILNSLLSDIAFLFQLNAQCLVSFADYLT